MLGLLGIKLYGVVTYSMSVPVQASVQEDKKPKDIDIKFRDKVINKASFQIISRKDLFRPERTASVTVVKSAPTTMANPPKLFATIVRGSNSIAIIEDPATKKSKTYRINEVVSGFLISEILEDRVILLSGDDKVEIKLRDDKGIKTSRPKPMVRKNVQQNTRRKSAPVRRPSARRSR